jgi:hypothetical protein
MDIKTVVSAKTGKERVACWKCGKVVSLRKDGKLPVHKLPSIPWRRNMRMDQCGASEKEP